MALLSTSSIGLFIATIFYGYWGIRISQLNTVSRVEYSSALLGGSVVLILLLLLSSLFGLLVIKYRKSAKWPLFTYGGLLIFWVLVFGGVAYAAIDTNSQASSFLNEQCNQTVSNLTLADSFYTAAELQMCTAVCPCNANASEWNNWQADTPANASTSTKIVNSIDSKVTDASTVTWVTSPNGYHDWQSCPASNATLSAAVYF